MCLVGKEKCVSVAIKNDLGMCLRKFGSLFIWWLCKHYNCEVASFALWVLYLMRSTLLLLLKLSFTFVISIHSVALFTLLKCHCVWYTLDKKEKNEIIDWSLKRNWMKSAWGLNTLPVSFWDTFCGTQVFQKCQYKLS